MNSPYCLVSGVSHVSCEPDVVHILDANGSPIAPMAILDTRNVPSSSNGVATTTTTIIDNRPLTIKTFKIEPGMKIEQLQFDTNMVVEHQQPTNPRIKLEPGLLQTLPPQGTPLKVEIHDSFLDSGKLEMCMNNLNFEITFSQKWMEP